MLHSGSALLCGKVLGRTMHQQDRSTLGKQGCDLLTLNPADLFMIGCNGEDGNFEALTQFAEILNVAVQHNPTHSGSCGSSGNLRHGGGAYRLKDDARGTSFWIRLNGLE